MFLYEPGTLINGINHPSLKSVGVPGTVAGLHLAHQKYGTLPWEEVVQPVIDLATNGVVLSANLDQHAQRMQAGYAPEFLKNYYHNSEREITKFRELWVQKNLANALTLIRDHGKGGFYKEAVADEIAEYMKANGGIITREDLR